MAKYNIILKDTDGYEISADVIEGLPAAKTRARYLLSEDFASYIESTHEHLRTWKVEVHDARGDCIWDAFL